MSGRPNLKSIFIQKQLIIENLMKIFFFSIVTIANSKLVNEYYSRYHINA